MAYLGISPNIGAYTKLDDISGSFDGIETTFSLTSGGKPFYTTNPYTLFLVLGGGSYNISGYNDTVNWTGGHLIG